VVICHTNSIDISYFLTILQNITQLEWGYPVDKQIIESFRDWGKRKGWPASFMEGNDPRLWKGGLTFLFDVYADGWNDHIIAYEKTLVWD
jgi:hypothetical protein